MSDNISANFNLEQSREAMDTPSSCCTEALFSLHTTRQRRHRRRSRNDFINMSRFFLLALCYTAATSCWRTHAFSSIPFIQRTQYIAQPKSCTRYMSSVAEVPTESRAYASENSRDSSTRLSDFQRRMKGLVKRSGEAQKNALEKPGNLKTVRTLMEYKNALDEDSDKIVVVRFHATWCKACKAVQPSYYRMASLYPHITFLDVPVTNENANLHQGLEVPSLPYGHIYYPGAGLVEEAKISKKHFPKLVKMVRWYDTGACGLDEYVPEDDEDAES